MKIARQVHPHYFNLKLGYYGNSGNEVSHTVKPMSRRIMHHLQKCGKKVAKNIACLGRFTQEYLALLFRVFGHGSEP